MAWESRGTLKPPLPGVDQFLLNFTPDRTLKFERALSRVARGISDAKILCIGDSLSMDGGGATPINVGCYPVQLARMLDGMGIPASPGLSIATGIDSRWTLGAGWTNEYAAGFGWGTNLIIPGGALTSTTAGSVLTFAPGFACDRFDVYYRRAGTVGTASIQATGGTAVSVNAAGAEGTLKATVSAGALSTKNKLTVTLTATAFQIFAIEPWDSTQKRVRVGNAGSPGSASTDWVQDLAGQGSVGQIRAYQPDLTIIWLGTNDAGTANTPPATVVANIETLAAAAAETGDVIVMTPFTSDPNNAQYLTRETDYAASMRKMSRPVLDIFAKASSSGGWTGWNTLGLVNDSLHLTTDGYSVIASTVAGAIKSVSGLDRAPKITVAESGRDIILPIGQSNMVGRGTPDATLDFAVPEIYQYKQDGTIVLAVDPLDHAAPNGLFGPAMPFARHYVREGLNRGRQVLLVPSAVGGTWLVNPSTASAGVGTWNPSVAGSLLDTAIARANAAIAAAPGSRIVAILWHQGESDAAVAESRTQTEYQTQLDALIAKCRSQITGAANVPFIVGGMVPEYLTTGTATQIQAALSGTPARVANTGYAAPVPDSNIGDNLHYDTAGQLRMAARYFAEYQKLRTGKRDYRMPVADPDSLLIPATQFAAAVGAPSLTAISTGTRHFAWMLDPTTDEAVSAYAVIPSDWAKIDVFVHWTPMSGNTGVIFSQPRIDPFNPGAGLDAAAPIAANVSLTAGGTAFIHNRTKVWDNLAVTTGINRFEWYRLASNASDTHVNDMALMALELVKAA